MSATEAYETDARLLPNVPLKACPFDGGTRLVVTVKARFPGVYRDESQDPDFYAYYVQCTSCAAQGPWRKSQSGAEFMWNGLPGTERGGPACECGGPLS